jgi:16S rRNA (guanine527-N7)-methyltransferase
MIRPPVTLSGYLAEVLDWNPKLGLISRKDPLAACERLLFESIELGQLLGLESTLRIADVGSGAGFPGSVWALLHPHLQLVLIERREKRALFLERTCRKMGATNAAVVALDVRDVVTDPEQANIFDLVVTMAVGDPSVVGHEAERLLKEGGRFASTISREIPPPARIGARLQLEQRHDGKFGCYAIYRSGV